jgi:hypothetical protein
LNIKQQSTFFGNAMFAMYKHRKFHFSTRVFFAKYGRRLLVFIFG